MPKRLPDKPPVIIVDEKEELKKKLQESETLVNTQMELINTQRQAVKSMTETVVRASNLLNQCLSILQTEGFNIRHAGAKNEKFLDDNKDAFIELILAGKRMAKDSVTNNPLLK